MPLDHDITALEAVSVVDTVIADIDDCVVSRIEAVDRINPVSTTQFISTPIASHVVADDRDDADCGRSNDTIVTIAASAMQADVAPIVLAAFDEIVACSRVDRDGVVRILGISDVDVVVTIATGEDTGNCCSHDITSRQLVVPSTAGNLLGSGDTIVKSRVNSVIPVSTKR